MGESDRIEHLLAAARQRLRLAPSPSRLGAAAPYVAPSQATPPAYELHFTAGQESHAAHSKRYAGRPSGRLLHRAAPDRSTSTSAMDIATAQKTPVNIAGRIARSASVPWSFRLVFAVSILSGLLVLWRLPGLFTPPVDAALGVESTHAAFVNELTGRVAAPAASARFLPPSAPWVGGAPTNPASSLPLYDWLVSGLVIMSGAEAASGHIVSIVMSLVAGLFFFASVRRAAGARAALYALLFYSVAPLSVVLGQQFAPSALLLATQSGLLLALLRWRSEVDSGRPVRPALAFSFVLLTSFLLGLVDPGAVFMAIPCIYVVTASSQTGSMAAPNGVLDARQSASPLRLPSAAIWLTVSLAGASILWFVFTAGSANSFELAAGDGGGGAVAALGALLNVGTYSQVVGLLVEGVLTVAGLLLLGAGLLHAARPPIPMIFHVWLASGVVHILFDASRLPRHDDVLLPIILPACALAGIGAAWAGALPARIFVAVQEQKRVSDSEYAISPHTSWLLDLPEERVYSETPRPQAQLAFSKSVAQRSQVDAQRKRQAWLLAFGHLAVFAALGLIVAGSIPKVLARQEPTEDAMTLAAVGAEVNGLLTPGAKIIVAGPYAPELFYASRHSGWALSTDDFSVAKVGQLQHEGADYLLSADQEWLGHHPDYRGLITTYSVLKLTRDYILFDLHTRPADNDRLYFLESGHTLGGAFRRFWERNGGVAKLGYPISEELVEVNPLDGQERTIQYFERAVLEYHPENAGNGDTVMLAAVGRWVTEGRDFPRVDASANTADKWYFAETGHVVKQAFLKYWLSQGGLATFGYPISDELPEINSGDGKVYTVQYFERARFEWHPTFAGTPDEVQLGLIGKQALELPRK